MVYMCGSNRAGAVECAGLKPLASLETSLLGRCAMQKGMETRDQGEGRNVNSEPEYHCAPKKLAMMLADPSCKALGRINKMDRQGIVSL